MLSWIINWLVQTIWAMGYVWIFVLMFLESSFFPFPSEVVMIPAWYLVYQWEMNLIFVIVIWILGSISWAWFNYILAFKFGRKILLKIIPENKLDKLDKFFQKHGHISTFIWRLIPWVRQYISFPAGLAKMNWWKFSIYTWLGAWIWVSILVLLWYFVWQNKNICNKYLHQITMILLFFILIFCVVYYYLSKNKQKW